MKKFLLLLMTCSALTSMPVWANVSGAVMPTTNANSLYSQSKDYSEGGKYMLQNYGKAGSMQQINSKSDLVNMYASQKAKEREFMYTAIGLSAEQRLKAETLDSDTKVGIANHIKQVKIETKKLRMLKAQKASKIRIWMQKKALASAKKSMDRYMANSSKAFDSLLTKEQKIKFDMINQAKSNAQQKPINMNLPCNLYMKNPTNQPITNKKNSSFYNDEY